MPIIKAIINMAKFQESYKTKYQEASGLCYLAIIILAFMVLSIGLQGVSASSQVE